MQSFLYMFLASAVPDPWEYCRHQQTVERAQRVDTSASIAEPEKGSTVVAYDTKKESEKGQKPHCPPFPKAALAGK